MDTSRTTGDEVLVCVFRRLVLFVILSCLMVLGILEGGACGGCFDGYLLWSCVMLVVL